MVGHPCTYSVAVEAERTPQAGVHWITRLSGSPWQDNGGTMWTFSGLIGACSMIR